MMNNIEIIINKENRMVDLKKSSIGNDGENLQYNLVFSFLNGFVDGQARLEYQISGEKYFAILEKHEETYTMPINSLLTKVGKILMQIVITQGTSEEEVPIFKSNVFYMFCNSSINAQTQEPDGYEEWLDIANTKLNELDNINIEATKENGVATITITNKDGSKEIVNLYDAEGAITNYEMLDNKPSINGVELVGDKTLEELNIQEKGDYLTSETDPLFSKSASYGITSQDIKNWNNKSEFSGNYDDLNGKPTIPTKTSELTNNSGFISEIPSEYVTEEELNNKKYLTSIPSEYVTESELNEKGYLTEHQSLDHLQEKLYSGENIKTINGVDILGSGNIEIQGGSGITEIPIATETTLGGIKVGANLTIEEDGTLNATANSGGSAKSVISISSNSVEKEYTLSFWAWTLIELNTTNFKLGDGFTHNGSKVVCNKDMVVRVDACTMFGKTATGEINLAIYKNGSEQVSYGIGNAPSNNINQTSMTPTAIIDLKAGDTLELKFGGPAGSYIGVEHPSTCYMTIQEL